jgi:hypothetical protein
MPERSRQMRLGEVGASNDQVTREFEYKSGWNRFQGIWH